jgi:hypothetical protein
MVNAQWPPKAVRDELRRIAAPARLSPEQMEAFLDRVSIDAQAYRECWAGAVPTADLKGTLEGAASEARRLLHALSKLQPGAVSAFSAHWDYLAYATEPPPPVELSELGRQMRAEEGRFLGALWELVQDFEESARFAAARCTPSKQAQVSVSHARALASNCAECFRRTAGRLPPYSKETWFPLFMATLCAWEGVGLACGRALVESAVKACTPRPTAEEG